MVFLDVVDPEMLVPPFLGVTVIVLAVFALIVATMIIIALYQRKKDKTKDKSDTK